MFCIETPPLLDKPIQSIGKERIVRFDGGNNTSNRNKRRKEIKDEIVVLDVESNEYDNDIDVIQQGDSKIKKEQQNQRGQRNIFAKTVDSLQSMVSSMRRSPDAKSQRKHDHVQCYDPYETPAKNTQRQSSNVSLSFTKANSK